MHDIRYVCLSDLHFGEEDSLLTDLKVAKPEVNPYAASPVMQALVRCLRSLIQKNENQQTRPTLILAGDILELALSNINVAAMVFEQFVLQVVPKKSENRIFDKIVYVPGNHDHHLWEWARETQYRQFIQAHPDMEVLPIPWHKTRMFPRIPVPAGFLNTVIQRHNHLKNYSIDTVYPNCGLQNPGGDRLAVITHGHLIEPLYRAMSYLKEVILEKRMPNDIDGIESENFAWIDFFW